MQLVFVEKINLNLSVGVTLFHKTTEKLPAVEFSR